MDDAERLREFLSREPSAERIAEMRREAEILRRLDRAIERTEARKLGREQGLRESIEVLCRALGIELDAARREELRALDAPALRARLKDLAVSRTWR